MLQSFRTSDGRRLTYDRTGTGPVLVCHPGGPGFSSLYFGDLAGLGADATLVQLNPRGTDGSDRPASARAYELDDYVSDLDELRRHLTLESFDLLGHSHGGIVAMAYAASHPARVDHLVLSCTLARMADEQAAAMESAIERRSAEPWYVDARAAIDEEERGDYTSDEELADIVFREFPFFFARYGDAEAAYLASIRSEVPNGDALRLFNDEILPTLDLRPRLAAIRAKTLVITGADDFITGPVCAREIASGIAGADEVVIEAAGHLVFMEQRDEYHDAVASHLAS